MYHIPRETFRVNFLRKLSDHDFPSMAGKVILRLAKIPTPFFERLQQRSLYSLRKTYFTALCSIHCEKFSATVFRDTSRYFHWNCTHVCVFHGITPNVNWKHQTGYRTKHWPSDNSNVGTDHHLCSNRSVLLGEIQMSYMLSTVRVAICKRQSTHVLTGIQAKQTKWRRNYLSEINSPPYSVSPSAKAVANKKAWPFEWFSSIYSVLHLFDSSPRGEKHGYQLYKMWVTSLETVSLWLLRYY